MAGFVICKKIEKFIYTTVQKFGVSKTSFKIFSFVQQRHIELIKNDNNVLFIYKDSIPINVGLSNKRTENI